MTLRETMRSKYPDTLRQFDAGQLVDSRTGQRFTELSQLMLNMGHTAVASSQRSAVAPVTDAIPVATPMLSRAQEAVLRAAGQLGTITEYKEPPRADKRPIVAPVAPSGAPVMSRAQAALEAMKEAAK